MMALPSRRSPCIWCTMLRASIRAGLLAVFAALAGPATGFETTIISADEQAGWNAVGRLNRGGYNTLSGCSAALVAPDLVLTAAHCIAGASAMSAEKLAEFKFVAGWNRGDYAAARHAVAVFYDPERGAALSGTERIARDIALVRLDSPVPADAAQPLPLAEVPKGDPLALVGYRNDRRHAPTLITGCDAFRTGTEVLFLTCPVVSGNSGSPVLVGNGPAARVVAVVSARGRGGAYAAVPGEWVRAFLP